MFLQRRLSVRYVPGQEAGVGLLRKLWRIRVDHFPPGPQRPMEADWYEFSRYFDRERRELIAFFHGGEPVGFYVNSHDVMSFAGKRAVRVSIEYTYMKREFRGHPAYLLAGFRLFVRLLSRYPLTPIYYVGFAFPNSFAFVNASFGRVFTLQEDPPPLERYVLSTFGREAGGSKWDAERQVARYKNKPPEVDSRSSKPRELQAFYERYERINPGWRDGDAIAMLAPADVRAFHCVMQRTLRRAARELSAA